MNTFESFAFAEGGENELARLINQEITECQSMGADEGSFAIHTAGRYQVQIRVTREYDNKLDTLMPGVAVLAPDEAEDGEDDDDLEDDDADNEEELAAFIKDDEDREDREEEEAFDREVHDEIMAGQDSSPDEEPRKILMGMSMLGLVTLRGHLEEAVGKQPTADFFTLMGKEDLVDNLLDNYTLAQITAALEANWINKLHPDRDVEEVFGETDDLAAGIQSEEELERLEEAQYKEFPSGEVEADDQTDFERHDPDHALVTSVTRTKERCVQLAKLSREDLLRLIEQGEGQAGIVTTVGTHISTLIDHLVDYYTHAQVQSAAKELGIKLASAKVQDPEL
ncbi:hypothetical protein SKa4_00034 [Pseudomonas phage vB_PpuM-SKa-4]